MIWICNFALEQEEVPEEWNKGKVSRDDCNSYREMNLLSAPGKICGRILNERMMEQADQSTADDQGGIGRGRGCVVQIFALKMIAERHLD